MNAEYEQLSLFTMWGNGEAIAINCMDNKGYMAEPPEPWMKNLEPKGEYVLNKETARPIMLYPVAMSANDIPTGYHYMHYVIRDQLYAAVYIGREQSA